MMTWQEELEALSEHIELTRTFPELEGHKRECRCVYHEPLMRCADAAEKWLKLGEEELARELEHRAQREDEGDVGF